MTPEVNSLAAVAGVAWFDYQLEAFEAAQAMPAPSQRLCLYYKTGAGKSVTALAIVSLWGHDTAVVIAPPSTHPAWEEWGRKLGVTVVPMSHAKFRQKGTRIGRHTAVIADEFHLFGGHKGQGWKKLDRLAAGLEAPLVLASATPNYNDAERVYCIQHVLDPHSVRGGYLQFLYANCNTEQNPFGTEPLVDKDQPFRHHKDAAEYLASLPGVLYLPDDTVYQIVDVTLDIELPPELDLYGYVRRGHRMLASQMEERHTRTFLKLVGENGRIRDEVYERLTEMVGAATTPVLIYANHATVATALSKTLRWHAVPHGLVTGSTTGKVKAETIREFLTGSMDVLVGTASLATGTDGMDKVSDYLIILDDTDDAALRRQLVGRIMPRGADTDATKKQVWRIVT